MGIVRQLSCWCEAGPSTVMFNMTYCIFSSLVLSGGKRPLNSLSVEEVKSLLKNSNLALFCEAVNDYQIDGNKISSCKTFQSLQLALNNILLADIE